MNRPSKGNPRRSRVAPAIARVLNEQFGRLEEGRVPDGAMLSVNHVDLNKDMSVAHVYVSVFNVDDDVLPRVVNVFPKLARSLRGVVGRELKLRFSPELRLHHDTSVEFRAKMDALLHSNSDE